MTLAWAWCGSQSYTFEGDWFFKRLAPACHAGILRRFRWVVLQRHPNLDFCATRSSVVTKWKSWCLLSCFIVYFCYVCLYFTRDETENVSPNYEKFPEFHLTAHQTSYDRTTADPWPFPFLQNVRCTRTHTVLKYIMSSSSSVLWQLRIAPYSLFNNHALTYYIPFFKTIICVSRRRHFTLQRLTLTQASLRGC